MGRDGPAEVLVIADAAALRAVAHPLRLRVLEYLRGQTGRPCSVKEIAAALGASPTKLYYHVHLLADHGLIRVVDTRLVSGIVERRYQVTAYRLSVDRALLSAPADAGDGLEVWLSVVLDEVRHEIRAAVQAGLIDLDRSAADEFGPRQLVLGRKWLSLTPGDVAEFRRRFDALMAEFPASDADQSLGDDRPDAALYEFLIGFYPTVPPDPEPAAVPPA
jgi:DNA-binding transcriptional ArsR family regulator